MNAETWQAILLAAQIAAATLLFSQKVLVLAGNRNGWLIGAVGTLAAMGYFVSIEMWILALYGVGIFIGMLYGKWWSPDHTDPRVELIIQAVALGSCALLLIAVYHDAMSYVQMTVNLAIALGTYLLTHGRPAAGWASYAMGNALCAWLFINHGQQFFADFQIASAIVCAIGTWQHRSPNT
jgi:hypothetical protein